MQNWFSLDKNCSLSPKQVDAVASSLNSNDAFVLVTPSGSMVWLGQGISDAEKNGAKKLGSILGVDLSEISEGAEGGRCTDTGRGVFKCIYLTLYLKYKRTLLKQMFFKFLHR